MKKFSPAFVCFLSLLILFFSCKKINESTTLGGNLIPGVDNVNTFEVALDAVTNNKVFDDTTITGFYDNVAIGHISNDPEFGTSHGDAYFDIGRATYGTSPFDSAISVDSVVLSLAYQGGYGDTAGSALTFHVFEIAQSSGFNDSTFYQYRATPAQNSFATTGAELGSKTFVPSSLNDSVRLQFDTSKVARVLRIRLDNSFGTRLKNYDTVVQYKNDTLFKNAFRGFAIKADATGNSFAYFNFTDNSNTKLIVYYKGKVNGIDSSLSAEFYHLPSVPAVLLHNPPNYSNGQADFISRTYSGNASVVLNNTNPNDDLLYIQSAPGTYASIVIPALDTFQNKVVHRAEIVATRIHTASENFLTPPTQLILDRKRPDTAFLFPNDLNVNSDGSFTFSIFGGNFKDETYRFNITRYVQGIITRHNLNDTLRIYAPLRTTLYSPNDLGYLSVPGITNIAQGRVVLAGGSYLANPAIRLRLRIIYSNL